METGVGSPIVAECLPHARHVTFVSRLILIRVLAGMFFTHFVIHSTWGRTHGERVVSRSKPTLTTRQSCFLNKVTEGVYVCMWHRGKGRKINTLDHGGQTMARGPIPANHLFS